MSDYILLISGIILMILGIIGCLVPVLPGPPLSFLGLILLHLSTFRSIFKSHIDYSWCYCSCCYSSGLYCSGMGNKKIRWIQVRDKGSNCWADNWTFPWSDGYNIRTIYRCICRGNDIQG